MEKITVIIERAENNYSAYIDGVDGIAVTGKTIAEIKQKMCEAIDLYVETCKDLGIDLPHGLDAEYELTFKTDVQSVLKFYEGIFSKAGLERITGINQKQLWHYANGQRPRTAQVVKIETALHQLGEELIAISM